MTKFNVENKDLLTIGESLGPAMKITDEADAVQYKKAYMAYIQKYLDVEPDKDGRTANEIANINLGYFAGYYSDETRERVERLFCCSHPVYGSVYK